MGLKKALDRNLEVMLGGCLSQQDRPVKVIKCLWCLQQPAVVDCAWWQWINTWPPSKLLSPLLDFYIKPWWRANLKPQKHINYILMDVCWTVLIEWTLFFLLDSKFECHTSICLSSWGKIRELPLLSPFWKFWLSYCFVDPQALLPFIFSHFTEEEYFVLIDVASLPLSGLKLDKNLINECWFV